MDDAPAPSITLHPPSRRVRVFLDDALLADTTRAIELFKLGYLPRQYLPRDEVRMDLLTPSDTVTHCAFQGDASYYSFGEHKDVARSYAKPLGGLGIIVEKLGCSFEELD